MPETKEQLLAEINRLAEWCNEMHEMIDEDGSVPANMLPTYQRQYTDGQTRLGELVRKAHTNGWMP